MEYELELIDLSVSSNFWQSTLQEGVFDQTQTLEDFLAQNAQETKMKVSEGRQKENSIKEMMKNEKTLFLNALAYIFSEHHLSFTFKHKAGWVALIKEDEIIRIYRLKADPSLTPTPIPVISPSRIT